MKNKTIQEDVSELEKLVTSDEDRERLERLTQDALSGASMKTWLRRFFFGFSLTDAIERWLNAFNPSIAKPVNEQIPKDETREVIAAWMRFSMRRTIVIFALSSLIAIVTAIALIRQLAKQDELIVKQSEAIAKQDEQIQIQIEAEKHKNTFLYLQTLYDQNCVEQHNETTKGTNSNDTEQKCTPKYNARQRAEALKGYIQLKGYRADLAGAHLENTKLSDQNFKGAELRKANLSGAKLDGAYLHGVTLGLADLSGTYLTDADLSRVRLSWADLSGAVLWNANLFGAKLDGADLSGAYLRDANLSEANLDGADLSGANLEGADLSWSDLREADLSGAGFGGADLSGADLRGSILSEAFWWETDLFGTHVINERILLGYPPPLVTCSQITEMRIWWLSTLHQLMGCSLNINQIYKDYLFR